MTISNSSILGISIAAIAISVVAIVITAASVTDFVVEKEEDEVYAPKTREILLFSQVDEDIDEENTGVPPDQYFPNQIVVKENDKVKIHFFNLEPVESQEHHTFTMNAPYQMNYDINAGEDVVIEFTALEEGVYDFYCNYHQPTMRGQLIVLED